MTILTSPDLNLKKRFYLPADFTLKTWEDIEPLLDDLKNREINSEQDLEKWLVDKNELESYVSENLAWRYITYTRNTEDEKARDAYLFFVNQIRPKLAPYENELNHKLVNSRYVDSLHGDAYRIYLRSIRNEIELYREENIPILTQIEEKAQEYSEIQGKMTIEFRGEELTMQQAAKYLKDSNRDVRREVYDKMIERRAEDYDRLDELYSTLVSLRHKVALNAGFQNYRDYKFKALGRFDYSIKDVYNFHESVREEIVPLSEIILENKASELGLDKLKPYDVDAEPEGRVPLKPYEHSRELIDKSISAFSKINPVLGQYLQIMDEKGYLDLDSRKGKAPGGYNYPLDEIGIPFIFMNASGKFRDLVTMMHEGGHAVHSFVTRNLSLSAFKHAPSEVSELASMSMELLSMDYWDTFFTNEHDLVRSKKEQLEGVIETLPWIATVDKFQNWVYLNPNHTKEERSKTWKTIYLEFHPDTLIEWEGYEEHLEKSWQKQLHIFEVPFYYIEYGIAQLGALAIWKNYKENKITGLNKYLEALHLGYTRSVPEIYKAAGISFDFSRPYIKDLAHFIKSELENLAMLEKEIPFSRVRQ